MTQAKLILASGSKTRLELLQNAGVRVGAIPAKVDEESVKATLLSDGHSAADIAEVLAEMKATKVSGKNPGQLVLGADQVLEQNGELFDKPGSIERARENLASFSGKHHQLISAAVVSEDGRPVFRVRKSATLHVRPLTRNAIDQYLMEAPASILDCVGAYQLEGLGAQLFHRIEGDYFTVLGLPLLDILGFLRERGYLTV